MADLEEMREDLQQQSDYFKRKDKKNPSMRDLLKAWHAGNKISHDDDSVIHEREG